MGYWQGVPSPFVMAFDSTGITFDTLSSNNTMSMYIADAGICDKRGDLLFYTNGIYIADATHDTMQNGGNLTPGQITTTWRDLGMPLTQSAIVLPNPADTNEYLLFHFIVNASDISSDTLVMTTINMSHNNGLGSVTSKNQPVYIDSMVSGQLTAVKHGNGRDWWLLCHQFNSDAFLLFLITPAGINGPSVHHLGQNIKYPSQACFSPNGQWYANYDNTYGLVLMNFDRCSGAFSNFLNFYLPDSSVCSGCCFSPNSKLLYASSRSFLYQLNLYSPNIQASLDTVAVWDGYYDPLPMQFVYQQLAPDNKVYITGWGAVHSLNVIEFPDSIGVACGVAQHSIILPGLNNGSMPNYPFYELGALPNSSCDTISSFIDVMNDDYSIVIFPNPALNKVTVTSSQIILGQLNIKNLLGQICLSINIELRNSPVEIDINTLTNGFYILEVIYDNKKLHKVLVKE
jgi:hypothetical protein